MLYGRVSLNGQPLPGAIVSAHIGQVELASSVVGSEPTASDYYGIAVSVARQTAAGETLPPGTVPNGSVVVLFLDGRMIAEAELRSGLIVRQDLSGGQALCSGGANEGEACIRDDDCPNGLCVAARALCDGGSGDGDMCECIGSSCSMDTACAANAALGTCANGSLAGACCDTSLNCPDGAACAGTQMVCLSGQRKGSPCLRNSHCPGSQCVSTGLVCNGGSEAGYSCADSGGCPGGTCGDRIATPTPTPTRTRTPTRTTILPSATPTPTPTPTPTQTELIIRCMGDCNGSGNVSVDELVSLVNIAVERVSPALCRAGDGDQNGIVSVDELVVSVIHALEGCE
jgi:hypothetical protein